MDEDFGTWEESGNYAVTTNFAGGNSVDAYDGKAFISGFNSTTNEIGYAYSTEGTTGSWTLRSDPTYTSTTWDCLSTAYSGSRHVCIFRKAADDTINVRYTDDDGTSWANTTNGIFTGSKSTKVKYINSLFVVVDPDNDSVRQGDGSTIAIDGALTGNMDVAWTGTNYVVVGGNGKTAYTPNFTTAWTAVPTTETDAFNHIVYDETASRLLVGTKNRMWQSDDDGLTWTSIELSDYVDTTDYVDPSNIAVSGSMVVMAPKYILDFLTFDRGYTTRWTLDKFVPLSNTYRATTFSTLDGYVVLFGTREYAAGTWTYYPRRARWTVPATYNDFTAAGSGSVDLKGSGAVLDSIPVNGRIVLFETSTLSALVPRGITSDPWDYDVIKDDFKVLSNPVVVDEHCYVVGADGLLWHTDGVTVSEVGSSFDLTEFDDFDETKPTWLTYSSKLKSLLVHRRSSSTGAGKFGPQRKES